MRTLLVLTLMVLSGCKATGFYLNNPQIPFPGVARIAVLPLTTKGSTDPLELAEILAGELVQFPGVSVVRPEEVQAVARRAELVLTDERSVRTLGRLANADAVLVVEITEYDVYFPPRIGFAAQLFFTGSQYSRTSEVINLSVQGRARPIHQLDNRNLIQIERVYDGSQREVRHLADHYARGHDFSAEAIGGADRVLRLPELYFRFVSNRLVRDIFAQYRPPDSLARNGISE